MSICKFRFLQHIRTLNPHQNRKGNLQKFPRIQSPNLRFTVLSAFFAPKFLCEFPHFSEFWTNFLSMILDRENRFHNRAFRFSSSLLKSTKRFIGNKMADIKGDIFRSFGNQCLFLLLSILILTHSPLLLAQTNEDYSIALKEFEAKNYEKSLEIIRVLHEQGKRSYETHYLAGHCHFALGRTKSAGSHWSEALSIKPGDPAVSLDYSRFLLNNGREDDGLLVIARAYELNPRNKDIRLLFGTALLYNGKARDALNITEKLKAEDSNDYRPLVLEGQIYYYLGNIEKAEVSLKWANSLVPNNANVLNNLALVYEKASNQENKKGKYGNAKNFLNSAKEQIESALKLEPENSHFKDNLRRIEAKLNALSNS
ncbi:tetratricopeptide repeat protein [Leptospira kirschneri str. 200803703]|nr:tetratricopeptide repeat protein [Leptospira kirschneri serovar Grippotyphosa str. RM52]EKQ85125.1 tetratricopeptide repeat protein [Leptospira kirschneri serovar Grippotyphosa str. Moskva]EKR06851.1 tetratricopeptide repeat protein [Leptospira kirschneri serovar Valbuzzi str. 200702274]EMK06550.1 tetratricopeptide repeat protein [Leptospira kirschneri str. MMD1493]EMK07876.1 tetratricopeptide repeat protein [Leptospira kirschneri]EMK16891.1 tetratricopeptide repeat protein [Leptospira kirs